MATHSSIFVRKIPRTEAPGRLQSMGSQRVRHNWVTKHTCTHEDIFTKKFNYKWKLFTLWILQTGIEFRNMNKRLKYVLVNTVIKKF